MLRRLRAASDSLLEPPTHGAAAAAARGGETLGTLLGRSSRSAGGAVDAEEVAEAFDALRRASADHRAAAAAAPADGAAVAQRLLHAGAMASVLDVLSALLRTPPSLPPPPPPPPSLPPDQLRAVVAAAALSEELLFRTSGPALPEGSHAASSVERLPRGGEGGGGEGGGGAGGRSLLAALAGVLARGVALPAEAPGGVSSVSSHLGL